VLHHIGAGSLREEECGEADERDDADPDPHRGGKPVVEEVEERGATHERKRNGEQHEEHVREISEVEVEEQDHDEERREMTSRRRSAMRSSSLYSPVNLRTVPSGSSRRPRSSAVSYYPLHLESVAAEVALGGSTSRYR
jgi:hypothetical protein